MRLRVKPGPRQGLGRVDLLRAQEGEEYYVRELQMTVKVTGIGRYKQSCLIFPLANGIGVGNEVTVERVLRCKMCGARTSSLINEYCDRCFQWETLGDMVAPPYAALICGRGG